MGQMSIPGMEQPNLLRRTFERIRPRMSPSLLVIGAQKAGTSALFNMLAQHPKAAAPSVKELDFFSDDAAYTKGMAHYRSLFPAIPAKSFGHFTFEASPSYLYYAGRTAPRIAKDLPGVICMAILRDPVKRAFSAWNMFRDFKDNPKRGHLHDPRSFQQAVEDELAGRTEHAYHCYLARGCYAEQVRQFKTVLPQGMLLIRSYKTFKHDPAGVVAEVCEALGQDPLPAGHGAFSLKANTRPYTDKLDPVLAKELYQYFAPSLNELKQVLGHELDLLESYG